MTALIILACIVVGAIAGLAVGRVLRCLNII